jgi:phosphate:Na+ symporter
MGGGAAITVATVGFVQAGLISFPSSLGIIFGANVGSTGLGWLVAQAGASGAPPCPAMSPA